MAEIWSLPSRPSRAYRLDIYGSREPLGIPVCGCIRQRSILAEIASILADVAEGIRAVRRVYLLETIALSAEGSQKEAAGGRRAFDGATARTESSRLARRTRQTCERNH